MSNTFMGIGDTAIRITDQNKILSHIAYSPIREER